MPRDRFARLKTVYTLILSAIKLTSHRGKCVFEPINTYTKMFLSYKVQKHVFPCVNNDMFQSKNGINFKQTKILPLKGEFACACNTYTLVHLIL